MNMIEGQGWFATYLGPQGTDTWTTPVIAWVNEGGVITPYTLDETTWYPVEATDGCKPWQLRLWHPSTTTESEVTRSMLQARDHATHNQGDTR